MCQNKTHLLRILWQVDFPSHCSVKKILLTSKDTPNRKMPIGYVSDPRFYACVPALVIKCVTSLSESAPASLNLCTAGRLQLDLLRPRLAEKLHRRFAHIPCSGHWLTQGAAPTGATNLWPWTPDLGENRFGSIFCSSEPEKKQDIAGQQ